MARRIVVQDGNVHYTTSDPTLNAVTFQIDGELNVGNDPALPGNINSLPGQDLILTAGNNISLLSPSGSVLINGLRWPLSHGTTGQVLTTNGSNTLSWTTTANLVSSAPANSSSTGTQGQYFVDGSFAYFCIATNSWVRTPVSTF